MDDVDGREITHTRHYDTLHLNFLFCRSISQPGCSIDSWGKVKEI